MQHAQTCVAGTETATPQIIVVLVGLLTDIQTPIGLVVIVRSVSAQRGSHGAITQSQTILHIKWLNVLTKAIATTKREIVFVAKDSWVLLAIV